MEENVLQKDFFKKNPLQELSAAAIADFGAKTIMIDSINEKMKDIVGMSMSKERRTKAEQDQQDVAQLAKGEDVVRYMRKDHDVLVDSLLCKKALSLIDDAGPHIVKRYKTTGQDSFMEPHPSGLIGEDPSGIPNNLMPYISQVAVGRLDHLNVYGDDYNTPDGTGVRDYIHVCDLASGHVAAIDYMLAGHKGENVFNLGTGTGCSVLDMVHAFERVSGRKVPYIIAPRRPGDLATVYSSPDKSAELLNWKARYGLDDMCRDAWNWQSHNPMGYKG